VPDTGEGERRAWVNNNTRRKEYLLPSRKKGRNKGILPNPDGGSSGDLALSARDLPGKSGEGNWRNGFRKKRKRLSTVLITLESKSVSAKIFSERKEKGIKRGVFKAAITSSAQEKKRKKNTNHAKERIV